MMLLDTWQRKDGADTGRSQTGGKIIGEGSYGCAFDRPLVCSGPASASAQAQAQARSKAVGKISLRSQAEVEIKRSDLLETIPYAKNYYALIENTCELAPRKKQTDADFDKCEVVNEFPYKNLVQIVMPYGGRSLDSMKKGINAKTIHFYEFGRHWLEAGALLLSKGIVHYDLHTGNVLVKDPNTPILIDFGISWKSSILNEKTAAKLANSGYSPKHSHYAPELSLCDAINDGLKLDDRVYADIIEKNGTHAILEKVFGIPSKKSVEALREFATDSTSIEKRDWLAFFKTYWPKIDAWGFGRILLRIYALMVFDTNFKEDAARTHMYKTIFIRLLHPNPRRRINVAQALALWDPRSPILKVADVARWLHA